MVYGFFKLFIVACQKCFVGLEDYVVDALALHDHMHLLRPLLADPTMLKVNLCCMLYLDSLHFENVWPAQHLCAAVLPFCKAASQYLKKHGCRASSSHV